MIRAVGEALRDMALQCLQRNLAYELVSNSLAQGSREVRSAAAQEVLCTIDYGVEKF